MKCLAKLFFKKVHVIISLLKKIRKERGKEIRNGRRKEEEEKDGEGGREEGKKALQVGLQPAIFNGRLEMSFTQALAQMKHIPW